MKDLDGTVYGWECVKCKKRVIWDSTEPEPKGWSEENGKVLCPDCAASS